MADTIIHGRGGVVYLAASSGAAAINVTKLSDWSIDVDYNIDSHLSLGSTWSEAVRGGNSWTGSFNGAYNTGSQTLWTAALSNSPLAMYIYPDAMEFSSTDGLTQYYYGTAFLKIGVGGSVGGKATVRATFVGSGALSVGV